MNNLRASIPGWQPFDNRSRHGTGFVKVNAQVRARHQLHGFFLKPRGFEEANASTDSRRFSPSGTTGNGVAGRLYSAWTNTLTTTVGASFNTFGARTSLDAFKGLDYGGPRVLVYDSANTSAGRLVGNGLRRHHWQQPELQCHAGQQAHRASRRELVPYGLDGLS